MTWPHLHLQRFPANSGFHGYFRPQAVQEKLGCLVWGMKPPLAFWDVKSQI
jgi:hypothetical protein